MRAHLGVASEWALDTMSIPVTQYLLVGTYLLVNIVKPMAEQIVILWFEYKSKWMHNYERHWVKDIKSQRFDNKYKKNSCKIKYVSIRNM